MRAGSEVLILKHVPNEGAGTILDYLKARSIPYRFIELYAGEPLPRTLESIWAVCVMGGPMNVDEEDKHPFLQDENRFIQQVLKKQIPILGVCLGSQLIAKALGARVYKAQAPEIGWLPVRLTDAARQDALFGSAPFPLFNVLQWHEDTFDLPAGAVLLAASDLVPHQAYRIGNHAWGLQFHVEVTREMLEDWFKNKPELPKILKTFDEYKPRLQNITQKIYEQFFR